MKLKILQLTPKVPYPLDDGGSIGIFGITKHLALRGHDIKMLSLSRTQVASSTFDMLNQYCKHEVVYSNTSTNIYGLLLSFFSPVPYTISKYQVGAYLKKIKELLLSEHFDCIHIDHFQMAPYIFEIKKHFSGPVFLREHSIDSLVFKRLADDLNNPIKKLYANLQSLRLQRLESTILPFFDNCITIMNEEEQFLKELNFNIKATTVPVGVDIDYFKPFPIQNNKSSHSIVYVGDLGWLPNYKGIIWFYKNVWPIILNESPDAKFYIVGKNPPKCITDLRSDNVIVTGFVDDVREYMAKASVIIVPLQVGGGMKVKTLNAFAMGKPVVSTPIGIEGIEVVDGKDVLIGQNSADFAIKILNVLTDKMGERLGLNARLLIETKYSWMAVAESFEENYCNYIKKHKKCSGF